MILVLLLLHYLFVEVLLVFSECVFPSPLLRAVKEAYLEAYLVASFVEEVHFYASFVVLVEAWIVLVASYHPEAYPEAYPVEVVLGLAVVPLVSCK